MTYCLRCNTPWSNLNLSGSEPSVFCDECRSLLRNRLQHGDRVETPEGFDLLYTSLWQEENGQASLPPLQSAGKGNEQLPLNTKNTAALYQTDAWLQLEQPGRESNTWMNQVDPLMARLDTYKLPSIPVEKQDVGSNAETVTNTSSPTAQHRSVHTSRRIAPVVLAMLLVLALAVSGAITFKNILQTQQYYGQKLTLWPLLIATAGASQLPSPTVQSTSSSSPASRVVQPTVSSARRTPGSAPSRATTLMSLLPVESVSSSALTFNVTQGQANPSGQAVYIANTGGSALNWTVSIDSSAASWLSTARSKGTVAPSQTGQVMVKVNVTGLTPGLYSTNLIISATDSSGMQAQGSPHVISVTLIVAQPCTLQITPSNFSFTVWVLQPNSSGKTIILTEAGNCAFPVSWTASTDQRWISLSATSGTDNGSGSAITVQIKANGMSIGNYSGQITLSAISSGGAAMQDSPQTISVTLTVSLL